MNMNTCQVESGCCKTNITYLEFTIIFSCSEDVFVGVVVFSVEVARWLVVFFFFLVKEQMYIGFSEADL